MPTYQYRCLDCSEPHEAVQRFTDDPLTVCPSCEGTLRKVFSAVGVVFKGSGFYATDSRAKKSSASTTKSADGKGAKPDGGDAKPAKDSAGKPAKAPAATGGGAPAA
ncbi:MAG: hypothetical protein KBG85_08805 [Micropruina sp.]|nr:hypothetical protein [Micropruina sp.]